MGVSIAAQTTMMITGPKKAGGMSPIAMPLLATINATSPRQAMPKPTCTHWRLVNPQSFAPSPQPISLETTATSTIITAKSTIAASILGSTTLMPMLAKKIGVSSR